MSQDVSPGAESIVVGGLYKHYKGHRYKILGLARHSETLEELVIYQAEYGEKLIWVRPLGMFLEDMPEHGQPRFKFIQ